MALQVLKRPSERNWSGNPIHYTLYSAAAEADPTIFFEIRVKFVRMDGTTFINVVTLPYKPVSGTAKIDIQDILDGLLEYELPYLPTANEYASPYNAYKMTGFFYIEYREITEADNDPEWITEEVDNERFIVKGGLSFEKWRGDNYWVNYFDVVKPFLNWEESGNLHLLTKRMYLAFLHLTDVSPAEIMMQRTLVFTDGSSDVALLNCPVIQNTVIYFPTGAAQLQLATVDPSKDIYYWEMQVVKVSSNPTEPLSVPHRYYADNKMDYNDITLNYRNSLGGLNSVSIKGVIDYSLEYDFLQNERVVLHNYFEEHFIKGRVTIADSTELLMYKGDIGYMGKEEQDRTRDLHLKREVWWEQQLKWLPVLLLTQSQRLRLSTDKLFSMPVVFCIATGGDAYYTPKNVNLQEGNITTGLICTAVINNLESNYDPGTGWEISWDLVSGAPNKYLVSTPGVSGGAPIETTTTDYIFPWLPVGDNVITVTPVCLIGGLFYLGTPQTITVTVSALCIPVGISSEPVYLPDAVEEIPYYFVLNLTGTAPFDIDTIVKPAWMAIAIVGSTVVLSGTPGPSDSGTDLEVSFNITNCSGGSTKAFSDTIDVLDAVDNGEFKISNIVPSGLNFVKNVFPNSPAFYSISTGALPVMPGMEAVGVLTTDYAGAVSVSVVASFPLLFLELYKNGVLQESIEILGTGIYSFSAVAYLVTDTMQIKLSNI
jgi:hypothetical protein